MKNIYETIFLYTINLIYILYIILLLGVNIRAPEYIYYLTEFTQLTIPYIILLSLVLYLIIAIYVYYIIRKLKY